MSVIIHDKSLSDNDCLVILLHNSLFELAKTLGKNSIVVNLKTNEKSPYFTLYFDERTNKIEKKQIHNFIIKIVVININPSEKNLPPIGFFYSNPNKFDNELLSHKLTFMKTFMIDCQIKGICPDCICSFYVDNKNFERFFNFFDIPRLHELKEIIKGNNN